MIKTVLARPRGTLVIYLAIVVLAAVSLTKIPVEGTPDTTLPSLNIRTQWYGADPEAISEQVTRPIEDAARQVEGVIEISSRSQVNMSTVEVSFGKGTDMDIAAMELTERIAFIREDLPSGVNRSSITQSVPEDLESEGFLIYSLTGAEKTVLKSIAEDIIKPRLERVNGVNSVYISGIGEEEIVIDVDTEILRSLDLTLSEVASAVRTFLIDRNVGITTDSTGQEAILRVTSIPGSIRELSDIIVSGNNGYFVTLGDISRRITQEYNENSQYIFRYNGRDQISLELDKSPGSNAVRVSGYVRAEADRISRDLPEGVALELTEDGTEGIREDLQDLSWRALLSIAGIIAVLFLLNPSLKSTPLILSSILFSAAISITAVYLVGFSINVLTLSALAIAFGLLVDGAVVVLESIGYQRRHGLAPLEAAGKGAREVAMPVLGGILTTMVAFIPLLASEGTLRLYYRPFSFTIAATLAASYVVCLTLVPSLAAYWKSVKWFRVRKWDIGLGRIISKLHHKPLIPVIFTLLLVGVSVWVFITKIEKGRSWGFSWERDYVYMGLGYPPGTPMEVVDETVKGFEQILANREGIESTRAQIYGEGAFVLAYVTEEALESGFALQYEAEAIALATTVGGIERIYVGGISPEGYWRSTRSAGMVQTVELRGYDYQGLKMIAESMKSTIERHPRVGEVNINWNMREAQRHQLEVNFDREELAALGMNPYQILWAFYRNLPGGYGGEIDIGDNRVDLNFRIDGDRIPSLPNILDGRVRTARGSIRLGDIADIDTSTVQGSILRENGEYIRTVSYTFMGAERMAARFRMTLLDNLSLPAGYRVYEDTTFVPRWLRQQDTSDMNLIVIAAILAVFAVTAIVFESFKAPLYVLAAIPLALVGVAAGFFAFDRLFTNQAYVGSVFLVGIAVNNSILLIDSFMKKQRAGMEIKHAMDKVVAERLRPILQTTATTVVGLLPLVLWPMGVGEADLWGTLAFTVVCGLLISTPLVLITLPALIQLTTRKGRK